MRVAFALVLGALLASCAKRSPPLRVSAAWSDGQSARYDLVDRAGHVTGTARFAWQRDGAGWKTEFSLHRRGRVEHGEVELDGALAPRASLHRAGGKKTSARYGAAHVTIETRAHGKTQRRVLVRPPHAVDNDALLELLAGLPFSKGYAASFTNVSPVAGRSLPVRVRVTGRQSVVVPAGRFDAWHVALELGPVEQDAWYAVAPPHLLVRYKNHGSTFELRAYRLRAGGPLSGNPAPPRVAAAPRVRASITLLTLLFELPIMIGLPLVLAWQIKKRTGASYALWAFGALTFIGSQVVHLPLNWALGLLAIGNVHLLELGFLPLPEFALAAGLSAGLCEELARYVTVRLLLRRRRLDFGDALELGAGHGGAEAMIIGALAAIAFVLMLGVKWFPGLAAHLGSPGALRGAADQYWTMAWSAPLVAGLERVSAIAAHLGMNVLVVRAGVERRLRWLVLSILAHTAVDAYSVWAMRTLGIAWTEIGVAVGGAALLAAAFAMRKSLGAAPSPAQGACD